MTEIRQQTYRKTRSVSDSDNEVDDIHTTNDDIDYSDRTANWLQNFVFTVAGIVGILLALRFIFVLFGANPNNTFSNLLYSITYPLVAPFRGLFGVDTTIETTGSRVEIETLTAILVYYLIALIIVKLISLARSNQPEVDV